MPETPQTPPQDDSRYPVVERFIERAEREEIPQLFQDVKAGLSQVKGPQSAHAKKAQAAIERAEELLNFLLDVRERLIEAQKGTKRPK